MDIHVYLHNNDSKLDLILRELGVVLNRQEKQMAALDDLTAQVAANTTVIDSAIVLLEGLKAALDAAGTDPVKLKALSDSLAAEDSKLAAAVAANTPAAPPAPPAP